MPRRDLSSIVEIFEVFEGRPRYIFQEFGGLSKIGQ